MKAEPEEGGVQWNEWGGAMMEWLFKLVPKYWILLWHNPL